MTNRHPDWPKTLEWIEKQGIESLKARFATADLIAKESQTTLTVLLAGAGGTAAYAAKLFQTGQLGPAEAAAATTCAYFVCLAIALVSTCMMFKSYPALYQDPENLMQLSYSIDELREAEIKNIGERIADATEINRKRARSLNILRVLAAISPVVFAAAASLYKPHFPPHQKDTAASARANEPRFDNSLYAGFAFTQFNFLGLSRLVTAKMPNHSLNRTHCGMRLKARHFILGF